MRPIHTPPEPYKEGQIDYNFGERKIGFRILASDVRRVEPPYHKNWEKADKNDPRWKYCKAGA